MSEELYFNDELRKCLNAAGLSDCGENDAWNYWYQRVHKAHDQAVDRVTEAQLVNNVKLRERIAELEELLPDSGRWFSAETVEAYVAENAKLRERVDELEGLTDGKRYIPQEWYQLATNENAKLRELVSRAWGLFLKHGAVHPCDLLEVDAVRDEMRELGIEVN